MGKLIYSLTTSLDGYISDKNGDFEWAEPSEEVHAFVNELQRSVNTLLLGRKLYEILAVWDNIRDTDSDAMNEFGDIWRDTRKIVYSTSLSEVSTTNTTLEREFNPEVVQKMVLESENNYGIGGAELAAHAIKAGIVDEYHQFIAPVIVGGGTHWLPQDFTAELTLMSAQKFDNGFVCLHYNKV